MPRWFWLVALCGMLLVPGCKVERQAPKVTHISLERIQAPVTTKVETLAVNTTVQRDTTKRGDTTFFHARTTVATDLRRTTTSDSTWFRIVMPDILPGIPYGWTSAPPDSLCANTLGMNSTVYGIPKATSDTLLKRARDSSLLVTLTKLRPCQARIWARIARQALHDTTVRVDTVNGRPRTTVTYNGPLSVKRAVAEINSWPQAVGEDTGVLGFHLGDDPADNAWGGTLASRMAKFDTIACAAKARWPNKPRLLRARAIQMSARPAEGKPDSLKWRCMTTTGTQWKSAWGDPDSFFVRDAKSAERQKLGMMVALNLLQGGKDSKVPLTAAQVMQSGTAALRLRRACAFNPWAYPPSFNSQMHVDTAVVSALKALSLAASVHPATNCIQR